MREFVQNSHTGSLTVGLVGGVCLTTFGFMAVSGAVQTLTAAFAYSQFWTGLLVGYIVLMLPLLLFYAYAKGRVKKANGGDGK